MYKNIKLFLIILFLISSCNAIENGQHKSKSKVYLVFCDITSSTDSKGIRLLSDKAQQIIRCAKPGSILCYYPIDGVTNSPPLLEINIPLEASTFGEKEENRNIVINTSIRLGRLIINRYNEINKGVSLGEGDPPKSCIINTFFIADKYFKKYRKIESIDYEYELIYLSDMIEQCPTSPMGTLDISNRNFNTSLNKITNYNPNIDLSFAKVTIVISSDFDDQRFNCPSNENLESFWQNAFMKVGFSADQIQQDFNFTHTLPPHLMCNE
jgi:hypothetical protein